MIRAIAGFLFGARPPGSTASELLLLVVRIVAGLGLALAHGAGKLPPSGRFVQRVAGMGFPEPLAFAWMSALTELGAGLLLAVGLLTRPAALAISINMAVAALVAHAPDPFRTREPAVLYLALALTFVALGGGRFSLDRLVRRRV